MRIFRSIVAGCAGWLMAGLAFGEEPAPRPVVAWAAGPMEARVAFDRAVDPGLARGVVGGSIGFGEGEKPGSTGRPGGDRGTLRIAAARLVDDGRTLVLVTDPHPRATSYRLTLPGVKLAGTAGAGTRVEVLYDLNGVEAAWTGSDQTKLSWSGWWPVIDPDVARKLAATSAEFDRLRPLTSKPGQLMLQTQVILAKGSVSLSVDASSPFEATFGDETVKSVAAGLDAHRATLKTESTADPIDLTMTVRVGEGGLSRLRVSTADGPLSHSALRLPWAPPNPFPAPEPTIPPELRNGGNPTRGEAVFFGEQAKCSVCHAIRGKGGAIGPDLSNLAGRDRAWAYQNIVEPSVSIHPTYVSYTVMLKDGRVAVGVVRAEGADSLKVGDIDGKQTVFPRAEVEAIRPSSSSIMPVGLLSGISVEQARDLLAFLTAPEPPKPGR